MHFQVSLQLELNIIHLTDNIIRLFLGSKVLCGKVSQILPLFMKVIWCINWACVFMAHLSKLYKISTSLFPNHCSLFSAILQYFQSTTSVLKNQSLCYTHDEHALFQLLISSTHFGQLLYFVLHFDNHLKTTYWNLTFQWILWSMVTKKYFPLIHLRRLSFNTGLFCPNHVHLHNLKLLW